MDPLVSGLVDWVFDGRLKEMYGYTDSDLVTLARVLLRPCPLCKAKPGDWCETKMRRKIEHLDDQHVARRLPQYYPPV